MKLPSMLNRKETIKLLKRLESVKAEYPVDMLAARRAAFLEQASSAGVGIDGTKLGAQVLSKSAHLVEKALQYILVGMLAGLSVATAYVYREDISEFLFPKQSEGMIIDALPISTLEIPSSSPMPTMTLTPTAMPVYIPSTSTPKSDSNPNPVGTSTPTVPGLHLGQTKTPKPD